MNSTERPLQIQWIAVHPTPYNVYLLSEISNDPQLKLTVHFSKHAFESHPWKSALTGTLNHRYFRTFLGLDWTILREAARNDAALFVIAGWRDLPVVALISCLSAFGRPFVVWTDTPREKANGPVWKEWIRSLWLQHVFKYAHAVMGTGVKGVRRLIDMGCESSKVINFPLFIDISGFSPVQVPNIVASTPCRTFVSSGVLVNSVKAFDKAIRALAIASERTGIRSFRYRIAGVGPDGVELERLAEQFGIAAQVEFVGWLEPEELPKFYRSGDVMLHPSLYDAYGVAVLEAMACGLAVFASDAAGVTPDRIIDGENGRVHPAGDVEALADQIAEVLRNPDLAAKWGRAARQTAEEWPVRRAIDCIKQLALRALGADAAPG